MKKRVLPEGTSVGGDLSPSLLGADFSDSSFSSTVFSKNIFYFIYSVGKIKFKYQIGKDFLFLNKKKKHP